MEKREFWNTAGVKILLKMLDGEINHPMALRTGTWI